MVIHRLLIIWNVLIIYPPYVPGATNCARTCLVRYPSQLVNSNCSLIPPRHEPKYNLRQCPFYDLQRCALNFLNGHSFLQCAPV